MRPGEFVRARVRLDSRTTLAEAGLIHTKLADRYDTFHQLGFEEKFNRARRSILEMGEEAQAERPD